nr:putative capsid protein [Cressdnaviricota sp.]
MAYKRKSYGSRRNGFKRRRRTVRRGRRRFRRSGNAGTFTSQSASGLNTRYKTRRIRPRAWRKILWRDTMAKTHYRSVGQGSGTITTGTSQGNGNVVTAYPTFIGVPSATTAFWTATGGLNPPDTGGATPTFALGDLTIRGGIIGTTVSCQDTITNEIGVTISVVKLMKRPNTALVPASNPWGCQIDGDPEFTTQFGKVLYKRTAILSGAYPHLTVQHRLRVQKIDQEIWGTSLGDQVVFIISCANLQTADSETLNLTTYHDMSFSGDVVSEA